MQGKNIKDNLKEISSWSHWFGGIVRYVTGESDEPLEALQKNFLMRDDGGAENGGGSGISRSAHSLSGGGGRGGPMSFGKSKAKLLNSDQISTTFADVAGVDEAKEDVSELVDFLSDLSSEGSYISHGVE